MLFEFLLFFGFAQTLGLLGTLLHTRKLPPDRRAQLHRKFAIYFLVTLLVPLASLSSPMFMALCATIALTGLYEIWHALRGRPAWQGRALALYLPIAGLFICFAVQSSMETILLVYCAIAALDGFSQMFGQLLGRTPLAPRISPAKTLEGSLGGIAAGLFFYWALSDFSVRLETLGWIALVLIAGILGDLLASACKRQAQIKDFSQLIPYHGGVLDRFDSFILAAAAHWLLPIPNGGVH